MESSRVKYVYVHVPAIPYTSLKVSVSVLPFLESTDWDYWGVSVVGDCIVLPQLI